MNSEETIGGGGGEGEGGGEAVGARTSGVLRLRDSLDETLIFHTLPLNSTLNNSLKSFPLSFLEDKI